MIGNNFSEISSNKENNVNTNIFGIDIDLSNTEAQTGQVLTQPKKIFEVIKTAFILGYGLNLYKFQYKLSEIFKEEFYSYLPETGRKGLYVYIMDLPARIVIYESGKIELLEGKNGDLEKVVERFSSFFKSCRKNK